MSSIMPTYGRLPVTFTRGDGAVLLLAADAEMKLLLLLPGA